MKHIKVDRKDYVILPQRELDVLLDDARAPTYIIDGSPLHNSDLSPTECRFIESLRENVKTHKRIVVRQVMPAGKGVSVFKFHLRDIGGK